MSGCVNRVFDPSLRLIYCEGECPDVDVSLRGRLAVDYSLLSLVPPSSLPYWARQLLGGEEACATSQCGRFDAAGRIWNYRVPSLRRANLRALQALANTGHPFVILAEARRSVWIQTLFRPNGGPVALASELLRTFLAGASLGAGAMVLGVFL